MRRWGMVAVVLLGVSGIVAPVRGQAKGDAPAGQSSWWPAWLSLGKKPDKKGLEVAEPVGKPVFTPRLDPGAVAARAKEDKDDLLRRVNVCDRLRLIAEETGDAELARKADHLEQRAWELYRQRLGQPCSLPADERVIERHLPAEASLRSGTAPSGSQGRAALREK